MSLYAIFINGVFRQVMDDIIQAQSNEPELVLFMQPYKSVPMKLLEFDPPSESNPIDLFISTTTELSVVRYMCQIVGWNDKTQLDEARFRSISEVIKKYQPTESGGIYLHGRDGGPAARNLLHVRDMKRFALKYPVSNLIKLSDGLPYSENRSQSGGWSYVKNPEPNFLFKCLNGYELNN